MTRRKIFWWLGGAGIVVAVFCAVFLNAGRFLESPAQAPVKADLIFALGGDDGARAYGGLWLYRKGFAPKILLGAEGVYPKARPAYLSWRASYLMGEGVPESALLYDRRSVSSWEEAVHTLQLMREMKLDRVLVVSDPPHMRRLSWVWGKVFEGSGKEFTLVAAESVNWNAESWWRTSPNAQFVFSEYIKLAYYLYQY